MTMKPKFREHLRVYIRDVLEDHLTKPDNVSRSKAMTRFYVNEILGKITPGCVPDDEDDFDSCMIDGKDDCGVDFLFRSGEGRVLIIQSKYRGERKHQEIDEFSHFCTVLKRIHPKSDQQKNQKLQEALGDIDWKTDTFDLQFLTLGRVGPNLKRSAEEGAVSVPEIQDFEERVELTLCEESVLNDRLREALTAGETLSGEVAIQFLPDSDEKPWLRMEGSHKKIIYVGHVKGSHLAELYRPLHHRFRLFSLNIRDYIGDNSTNKGIKKTALERPDDFQFFNNGISAVASSIEENEETNTLRCRNFSIINGAQTVRSLDKAQRIKPAALRDVVVMLRIFKISIGKESEFIAEVTRYNNTQNKISVADFRSNDPVQKDLVEHFRKIRLGTKRFWYKNKRSRESRDMHPIEMIEFAKTLHSFKYGPQDMWGGTSALFDPGPSGRYVHVFGDGSEVWTQVTNEDFRLLAGTWFLCDFVRSQWKAKKKELQVDIDPVPRRALERRYMVFYAVGKLLDLVYVSRRDVLREHLRELSKPDWTKNQGPEKTAIQVLMGLAFTALVDAYRMEEKTKSERFVHRNWFRDKATLAEVDERIRFIVDARGKENIPLLLNKA